MTCKRQFLVKLDDRLIKRRQAFFFTGPAFVIDAKGNQTSVVYDLMGRRLSIDNPDTGKTLYTYDANGNVTSKETANLRTAAKKINYVYDYNRLAKIDYPDSVDVQYEYGSPSEAGDHQGNLAGRIKRVTDESGEELRYYGRLGETLKELRQVNAKNNPISRKRYETRYVFDSFGRMQQMTYPDGEVLYYVYDRGGLLKEASGIKRGNKYVYIDTLQYDKFGQRTYVKYGNRVETRYTYDAKTRRLSHLWSKEPTKGRVIQDITYGYDLVGNIMSTSNKAPVPSGGEIGGPTEQHFTYDDLYQLTTGNGYHLPAAGKKTQYTNNINYDIIGNITRKVQTHLIVHNSGSSQEPGDTNYTINYQYLGNQPHAVTDTEDKKYFYDKNGNMTGWASKTTNANRIIAWNEENRVKSIADSGSATEFLYDYAGERATKGGGGNETVYLNRFYSLRNGDLGSKHIFAGETRVCTKLEKDGGSIGTGIPGSPALANSQGIYNALHRGNGNKIGINRRIDAAGTAAGKPPIEKFEFFYHGDHLGSSSFITDDAGAVYQHLEYFPYGETWVDEGGTGQMPYYRFTGKELDPETGLYYFGARYYDPVLSKWISADPLFADYLPNLLDRRQSKENWNPERDLPGMGGVFEMTNLNLYHYAGNNPVFYIDAYGQEKAKPVVVTKGVAKTVVGGGLVYVTAVGAATVTGPVGIAAVVLGTIGGASTMSYGVAETIAGATGHDFNAPSPRAAALTTVTSKETAEKIDIGISLLEGGSGTFGALSKADKAFKVTGAIPKLDLLDIGFNVADTAMTAMDANKTFSSSSNQPAMMPLSSIPPPDKNPVLKCHPDQ